jgi:hypothetical protein
MILLFALVTHLLLQAEFQGDGAETCFIITVVHNGVDRTIPARVRGIVASLLQSHRV